MDALHQCGAALIPGLDPGSADALLRVGKMLGSLELGIDENLAGPRIMHLRFDPARVVPGQGPAYFTRDEFPLHTDVSYVTNPPRFMLVHCVNPDPGGGGACLLADCRAAIGRLAETDGHMLSRKAFRFLFPPGCNIGESEAAAIREPGFWRFKPASMRVPAFAAAAVKRFQQALTDVSASLLLARGDLLVVDNHRVAHGRTAFGTAQTGHAARHLMRLYATTSA